MTVPLMILAFFSIVAGYIGLPVVLGKNVNWIEHFLHPVMAGGHEVHLSIALEWLLIFISVGVALFGIYMAYVFYMKKPHIPYNLVARFPKIHKLLFNKYYVDEIYEATIVNPLVKGSEIVYENFDLRVIDGTANGSAKAAGFFGKIFSYFQTGLLKDYALIFLLGAILILGYLLF